MGVLIEHRNARHDHARGAVAALHGAKLEESFLHGVQLAVVLESLDGGDLLAAQSPNK